MEIPFIVNGNINSLKRKRKVNEMIIYVYSQDLLYFNIFKQVDALDIVILCKCLLCLHLTVIVDEASHFNTLQINN